MKKMLIAVLVVILTLSAKWQKIDEGLHFQEFDSPQKSIIGDSKIKILKIDTKRFSLKLFTKSETKDSILTATEWSEKNKLPIVFNAGMFKKDYTSNVGFMKNYDHYNNKKYNKSYKSFIVFNPKKNNLPNFDIVDISNEKELKNLETKYNTIIQNLRMVNNNSKNVWSLGSKISQYSELCLGVDKSNNCLVLFSRSPYYLYDLNNILLDLPLNLKGLCHLEGGPEASISINYNNFHRSFIGSYETGFNENDDNEEFWELPNVIGVMKK